MTKSQALAEARRRWGGKHGITPALWRRGPRFVVGVKYGSKETGYINNPRGEGDSWEAAFAAVDAELRKERP